MIDEDVPSGDSPHRPVWVLDDPRAGTASQAIGIAERLGLPFRRIPIAYNWLAHAAGLARRGSLIGIAGHHGGGRTAQMLAGADAALLAPAGDEPELVISSGSRSAAVALWLKSRHHAALVHCMRPGLGGALRNRAFDLLVLPEHDDPPEAANVLRVLGAPHRVSPLLLAQAAAAWEERLAHLPHPRIALLVGGARDGLRGGAGMAPALAHTLGRRVANVAVANGGSVMATTSRRTGTEATEALSAGLGRAVHLLYRWGEPDENPYLGFLACADAIVVTADSISMLSEACATSVPVYVALPSLGGHRHRAFIASLHRAGHVRPLTAELTAWPRTPLDEAGRVAAEIVRRFGPGTLTGGAPTGFTRRDDE